MAQYSHSKLSTFEQCPYKYKLRYIEKIIPEIEKSIEAHLGTCVHYALEWVYKEVLNKKIPTLDEVIVVYSEKWNDEEVENFLIVKKEFTSKDYFEKGLKFIIDYYSKNHPFEDGTVELEKEVKINLGNSTIIGYIDRLSLGEEEIQIHDYKTANSIPSKEKIETDRQLALYSIAIKEKYGKDKKVKLVWHYLAHNLDITSSRTEEQLENLKKDILELIDKIEKAKEFPKCESVLCNWCEYKNICCGEKKEIEKDYPTVSKYIREN